MIKHRKDFAFGLLAMILGTAFAIGAKSYSIGTAARMGAGYFPFGVACLLAALGSWITLRSLQGERKPGGDLGRWILRPVVFVLGSNVLFGILLVGLPGWGIPGMGLLVAVFATVIVAALASQEFRLREVIALSSILTLSSYLLFVVLLKLNLPVLPSFFAN
jgi:hypothetical protein